MKSLIICLFAAIAIPGARAALNDFNGDWENADRNTRGITKLQIAVRGANVKVQAWGSCTPQDCNWGAVQGAPYSSSVNKDMIRRPRAITAIFSPSHAQTILVITQAGRNKIKVDAYTHFKSGGRNNYVQTYTMVRSGKTASLSITGRPRSARRRAAGRWPPAICGCWISPATRPRPTRRYASSRNTA
jgi:hypothetical protein